MIRFRTKLLHADLSPYMNYALKNGFSQFKDEESLRYAIDLVCVKFGKVVSLTILPAKRAAGLFCTCILQLDSKAAENEMKSRLDVMDFGTDLVFFAEVDEGWTGPST